MRRLLAAGAVIALLVMAAAPFTSAGTSVTTRHVDGSVTVHEPSLDRDWLARFEIRTTTSGDVLFGYLELYGITPVTTEHPDGNLGQIHQYVIHHVDYARTATGQAATLRMDECIMIPQTACQHSDYDVADGPDAFLSNAGWSVVEGNISIYSTTGQNAQ